MGATKAMGATHSSYSIHPCQTGAHPRIAHLQLKLHQEGTPLKLWGPEQLNDFLPWSLKSFLVSQ